jgi:integrating conjugative element protein (TIGR03757 family)
MRALLLIICTFYGFFSTIPVAFSEDEYTEVDDYKYTYVIEVFTDKYFTPPVIPGFDIRIYDLSEMTALNRPIVKALPDQMTHEFVKKNIHEISKDFSTSAELKHHVANIVKANKPYELMIRYRVLKIPAIVFEGAAVVYGTLDVERALNDFYQAITPESREIYRRGLK